MIRRPLFLLLSILLFAGAVGFLAYRPATVTGVDAKELASSLKGAVDGSRARCVQDHGSTWRCAVRGARGGGAYRVKAKSLGCWDARIASHRTGRVPRRPSGCITILDYF